MIKDTLKRTGRLACLLAIVLAAQTLLAGEVETDISKSIVQVGEPVVLSLKVSGASSDLEPSGMPSVKGLEISYSGMQRSFQFINGKTWSGVTLNFTVVAMEKGTFTIPSFILRDGDRHYTSGRVQITAMEGGGSPSTAFRGSAGGSRALRTEIELSAKEVVAGEPLLVRYYIYSRGF